ncbi:MAG: 2-amino-4-hydroxy-6-hydroxymethyldihydropteridine diphosphokinase [Muribaculaceae bacterium]|nr:2-amino-4-hydroxy-6-hydroxymethyldihydropteridine diphosphokinase [Muribaculaceae bacterium]
MVSVVIGIGSNFGNRKENVEKAMIWLQSILIETKCSAVYETPCASNSGKNYMNAVISGVYQGTGFELEDILKEKEKEMGRNHLRREAGEVPIDLDIVICDGEILKKWDYRQKFFRIGYLQL